MKIFMKIYLVLIVLIAGFYYGMPAKAQTPQKQEYELWKLQNSIIKRSFKALHKGAWVKRKIVHNNGYDMEKDVYIGNLLDTATHKRFFVVEVSIADSVNQVWCRFVKKTVFYKGKPYKFETIKPIKAYIHKDGRTYYVSESLIDNFMKRRGQWSIILYQGKILNPPNENNNVDISNTIYKTQTHKIVRAKKIKSLKNGGEIVVSEYVPFGFVQSGNSFLYDFGFNGEVRRITKVMIKHAIPLSGLIPGSIPINGGFAIPKVNPFK